MANIGESQIFELRRSSCAKVSQRIAAIDYDRASAIQMRRRVVQNAAERNVNRTTNVGGVVLVRRKYVDDLRGARREHRGKLTMLYLAH